MAGIELQAIGKTYDNGHRAVQGVSLSIRDREFMVLVGPSGCGKTTVLRMIAGLEGISSGEIRIGGRRVNEVEPKDRDIAMVFQNYALYPHMTVRENLAFALRLRGMPAAAIAAAIAEVAEMLGLVEQLERLPKQLSGGQRQRVALGRAIVRKPQAFLFDEPLSNLDAQLRAGMRCELKALQARLATTAVYVTHDQIEAMTLGDRITVMNRGEIQQVASPAVIYDFPWNRFVAGFIGTPPMNFLGGRLERDGTAWRCVLPQGPALRLDMPEQARLPAAAGAQVALGIRPEHLRPAGPEAAAGSVCPMQVVVVEHMGDHQYVHLRIAGAPGEVIMKTGFRSGFRAGDIVQIQLDTAQGHLFAGDAPEAENLTLPPGFQRQAEPV